jgi:hypothetical protein
VRQEYGEGGQEAQAGQRRDVWASANGFGCGHRLQSSSYCRKSRSQADTVGSGFQAPTTPATFTSFPIGTQPPTCEPLLDRQVMLFDFQAAT